jgi:hypothetical protein
MKPLPRPSRPYMVGYGVLQGQDGIEGEGRAGSNTHR